MNLSSLVTIHANLFSCCNGTVSSFSYIKNIQKRESVKVYQLINLNFNCVAEMAVIIVIMSIVHESWLYIYCNEREYILVRAFLRAYI